jgi:dTDP-L-rhamnose 4-epimerase
MTTALVTGGAGLIGSHIVDLLLRRAYRVRILDNLEPSTHLEGRPAWIPAEAEFIQGDVRNTDDVRRALQGVEVVFHQAAYGGFALELTKMTEVNAGGTARLFEVIRTDGLGVRKIVTASSQAVYGEGKYECARCGPCYPEVRPLEEMERRDWELHCPVCRAVMRPVPIDEGAPLKLNGTYHLTKYFEERLTLGLGREWGIPAVALRYMLTYGPRQSVFNPYTGICSIFSTRFLNGLAPVIYEDGQQTRDFVFVEDVARANLVVMESEAANGRVFNVGSGCGTSILRFAELLRGAYGSQVSPSVPGQYRPVDFRHLVPDTSGLRALGWSPMVSLEEGVGRYARWILSQRQPAEYFTKAEALLQRMRVVRQAPQVPVCL